MGLSKAQKEALAEHYKGKDAYDPSQAKEQEVATFMPKPPHGDDEKGYADGGDVGDFAGPAISADTSTATQGGNPLTLATDNSGAIVPEPDLKDALANYFTPTPPASIPATPRPVTTAPPAHSTTSPAAVTPSRSPATPAASSSLSPDQFDALINGLQPSMGQRVGKGVFSGLAGLADAIESGVARAGNPGFQKNIEETQQQQIQNLIEALRAKYEAGYKGQELAQGQQRLGQEGQRIKQVGEHDKATEAQSAAMLKFDQDRERINSELEGGKISLDEAKAQMEAAQKGAGLFNAIGRKLGYGPPLPSMPGERAATHPQDAKAVAWAKANPRDPRSAKIMKANGQ